jgi:hypothetical protein
MTKLKIKVTKEILEKSKWCGTKKAVDMTRSTNCAIALAVRDIFPNATVGPTSFYACNGAPFDLVDLPRTASEFINDFDDAKPEDRPSLAEIEFEVEIPDSVIGRINIEELRPLLQNHPTLQLVNS